MRTLLLASDVPTPAPQTQDLTKAESVSYEETSTTNATTPSFAMTSRVPTVVLDTDVVSDLMAARLCTSLLGHVLFLKNQVPFPIVQLARMPTTDNATGAAKKRHELLNSFDALASHLYTTFIALSTALALRGTPEKAEATGSHRGVSRAFFALALGPTVGTAKSRVMVGIDGLERKVWGLRQESNDKPTQTHGVEEDGEEEGLPETARGKVERSDVEESEHGSEEEEGEEDVSESDEDASPPPSRSPSPALSSDSDSSSAPPPSMPEGAPSSRIDDPETIRAAERLLSRTLASACAEDDGQGLAAEMAPTQIHVLLRAPRRFDHPSWTPRQNLCASLDGYLADFLVESGQMAASRDVPTQKRAKASKVQGVWITSRASTPQAERSEQDLAEEDELMWWSWDGKLAGFADW